MKATKAFDVLTQISTVEMADLMRSDGKIYVVVIALLLVFGLMSLYIFFLDRKVRQLTQQSKEEPPEEKQRANTLEEHK